MNARSTAAGTDLGALTLARVEESEAPRPRRLGTLELDFAAVFREYVLAHRGVGVSTEPAEDDHIFRRSVAVAGQIRHHAVRALHRLRHRHPGRLPHVRP